MTVAIVGAGVTGLACAAAVGRSAVVVDRIPVCGGARQAGDAGADDRDRHGHTSAGRMPP